MRRTACSLLPIALVLLAGSRAGQTTEPGCVLPAKPGIVRVTQSDGETIALRFQGDGRFAWYEDLRGYPVVRRRDTYLYAVVDDRGELRPTTLAVGRGNPRRFGLARTSPDFASARRARAVDERGKPLPRSTGSSHSLTSGTTDNFVLLVRFADHGPSGQDRTLPSEADVEVIMNAVGGDPTLAPTGSVRDFYLESSYGAFTVDSDAEGWFDLPGTEGYYADGVSGLSTTGAELVTDGLNAADPSVDFSLFDQDLDGVIDSITVLHSGYGAEHGGVDEYGTDWPDRIWSHKWEIPTWTSAEGVTVTEYNVSPGLWDITGDEPAHIGVIVHELGHFFGLPDLYDTDGSGLGDGNWEVMAYGSWGFDGDQLYPTHLSPWSKWKLGWIDTELIVPGTYVADPVETNPTVYRIQSGYPTGEHILIENRQPIGFDALIPQAGLLVWHVDDAVGSIADNDVNNIEGYAGQPGWPENGNHYRNALLQADDFWDLELLDNPGDAGDVYHEAGVDEILTASSPDLDTYQDGLVAVTGNEVKNITNVAGGVSFDYCNTLAPTLTTSGVVSIWFAAATVYDLSTGVGGGSGTLGWTEVLEDPVYTETPGSAGSFAATGVAQGWNADDATWSYTLPFAFPFYAETHRTVSVSSNGFLDFVPGAPEGFNQRTHLRLARRIAPLWDDLDTSGMGEDVFIDERPGEVEIRWAASTYDTGDPCNVSVVLGADGSIEFRYGQGNTNLTPTVGISRGHSGAVSWVPGYDGSATLTNASSYSFELSGSRLPPGMRLTPDGRLVGRPTKLGTFEPLIRVTDADGRFDQDTVTIEVISRPKYRRASEPPGE